MFLTVGLLTAAAICLCAGGMIKIFRVLELDPMQMLLWVGLAEEPVPRVGPRPRPGGSTVTGAGSTG